VSILPLRLGTLSPPFPFRPNRGTYRWLYAPTPQSVGFALRTTAAALLATGIALWMELDSPVWAAMTVWAVAQSTRGESLSKARWRIIGTIIGALAAVALIAAFPQAPWLFFPAIAAWIGLCSGFATFVSNFRSYALVLAGYTCSIIAMDAVANPDNVFFIAISRSTYIVLGVVCEAIMGMVFATNQEAQARQNVRRKLQRALTLVTTALADILTERDGALSEARDLFGPLLKINDEIEFSEVEMGPHGHEGDHARAALAAVSVLLSRVFGMSARLGQLNSKSGTFRNTARQTCDLLRSLPERIGRTGNIPALLGDIHFLREECWRQAVGLNTPAETTLPDDAAIDERILHVALGEVLGDLETAVTEYEASTHYITGDHFHFRLRTHRDSRAAFHNGMRGAAAVLLTALIYEVTAWHNGLGYIAITTLICGLFATRENPVLATSQFFTGTVWSAIAAWFLVFVVTPHINNYEGLVLTFGFAMFLGGLAKANPGTAGASAAYGLLMPAMTGLQNHHRLDEIGFFNGTLAILAAAATSVIVFRLVLPFNSDAERLRLRRQMLAELRALAHLQIPPQTSIWIGRNIDRFARLIRHAGPVRTQLVEDYLEGTLAVLTLGLNVIRLRALLAREHLPDSARRPIELLLVRLERETGRHEAASRSARRATDRMRWLEQREEDSLTRLEMTRALAYLVVISHALRHNSHFMDEKHIFTGNTRRTA